jgi:anaerobic selenocysteine-containing dehydrogenase
MGAWANVLSSEAATSAFDFVEARRDRRPPSEHHSLADSAIAADRPEMVLVSRRQLRSMNSWMHNLDTLVRGKERCTLQIHRTDAIRLGIASGEPVTIRSAAGEVVAPAELTDAIRPGVVCLPHGWGHRAPGSRLGIARLHPGTNINAISPAAMIDAASGNAVCNGIPVEVIRGASHDSG